MLLAPRPVDRLNMENGGKPIFSRVYNGPKDSKITTVHFDISAVHCVGVNGFVNP